jgi:hypothetical protein
MTVWQGAHVSVEGDSLKIGGVEIWRHKWRTTGEHLNHPYPSYRNQIHLYEICEVPDVGRSIRFAVCKLSNGVYGFYVPE